MTVVFLHTPQKPRKYLDSVYFFLFRPTASFENVAPLLCHIDSQKDPQKALI